MVDWSFDGRAKIVPHVSRSCPASFWSVRRDAPRLIYTSLRGVRYPLSSPPRHSRQRWCYRRPLTAQHPRATAAPRRCPNCAIRTKIEPAIFQVMSSCRLDLTSFSSPKESLLISFHPSPSRRLQHPSSSRTCVLSSLPISLICPWWSIMQRGVHGVGVRATKADGWSAAILGRTWRTTDVAVKLWLSCPRVAWTFRDEHYIVSRVSPWMKYTRLCKSQTRNCN